MSTGPAVDGRQQDMLDRIIVANAQQQVEFTCRLVAANSVNALPLQTDGAQVPVELEVAKLIHDELASAGYEPALVGLSAERRNVLLPIKGTGTKALILNGHMDTVAPSSDWTIEPLSATIIGNRLYGLGSLDMKASLAMFVYLARALKKAGVQLGGDLILTFVVDEELGAHSRLGTAYLLDNGLHADAAIVAEPGQRKIAIGHRGAYRFRLTVFGESAHTGRTSWERHEVGRNAIVDMARTIEQLQGIEIPAQASAAFVGRRSVFTFPTLVEGGTAINTVPDHCVAYGDCRLLPGVGPELVERLIRERLERISDVRYQLESLLFVPAVEISPEEPVVRALVHAALERTGRHLPLAGSGPSNDGWMFIERGIPAICGFGPCGENAHSSDEFVEIDSIVETTQIYARAVLDFLRSK